jgi:acyl-homoserine-lactone acylase
MNRAASLTLALAVPLVGNVRAQEPAPAPDLARQVEVLRTGHGVPHIKAQNLKAAAYALAYVQLEDHGATVAVGLVRARGEMGRWFGRDSMENDFLAQRGYALAVERYPQLDQDTRDVYEGFAAGVNRYITLHPEEFPPGFAPRFTASDVAARDVRVARPPQERQPVARRDSGQRCTPTPTASEEGSNAWAFAPRRTKSGRAILLRNPHLAWTAGYYEAHLTVPGVLDFLRRELAAYTSGVTRADSQSARGDRSAGGLDST